LGTNQLGCFGREDELYRLHAILIHDAIALDPIDRADMDTVRADYFHMFLDVGHDGLLVM
jgi:hypothetical protein